MKKALCFLSSLLAVALLSLAPAFGDAPLWTELPKDKAGKQVSGPVELSTFATLAEELSPSVVHITVTRKVRAHSLFPGSGGADSFERFFGFPMPKQYAEGLGSGVVINKDGHILTNNHVVEGTDKLVVKLVDEREYEATLVGADPLSDLALIKIEADSELVPAPLGDSDGLRIAEWVIAIGNPFGLDHTVTAGIVSAKGRKEISPGNRPMYANFIQTDASINPGNSGGPLINMRGEVVGINTAIAASGQGIGFAIPVNMAKKLIPQLAKGRVERSYLGVLIQEVTQRMAKSLGLENAGGALVAQVLPDSPAEKGGVLVGDVVTGFNGKPVEDSSDLPWLAATAGIGEEVLVEVFRAGKSRNLQVVMGAHPDEVLQKKKARSPEDADYIPGIGIAVGSMSREMRKDAGIAGKAGVIVTAVKQPGSASLAGIRPGDIILRIGYVAISSPKGLARLCARVKAGAPVSFHVKRGDVHLWVALLKE